MAIKSRKIIEQRGIEIDLTGEQGNAYYILGMADKLGKQLLMTEEEIQTVHNEMKAGDYENLVAVFDGYFGNYATIYR